MTVEFSYSLLLVVATWLLGTICIASVRSSFSSRARGRPNGHVPAMECLATASGFAFSDGTLVDGRRPDRRKERRLRRAVSRSRRGSARRTKRVAMLARETHCNQVRNRNAVHEITTTLVRSYGRIAVEALQVSNMTRSAKGTADEPGKQVTAKRALNRRILDQTWGELIRQLTYKAGWAGREFATVHPAYTSQDCSNCGARTPQFEHYRVHRCTACGAPPLDRDVNAARNVLVRSGLRPHDT